MGVLLIFRSLGLIGQVSVDLSGGQMLVAQQLLYFPEIGSTVDQMGGIGMTKRMGAGPFVEACPAHIAIEDLADGTVRDSLAEPIEQHRNGAPVSVFRNPLGWNRFTVTEE